jgi:IAA-amino acid hydrolase
MMPNDLSLLFPRARALQDRLRTWRRHLHQHPELAFQEVQTARYVAEVLTELGVRVRTGVGRTGVVGEIGAGEPVVALRADMDALPIQEANETPYASCVPGVMHACGHDAHTAWLLGAAALLAAEPPPQGRVRFLFQPSEENRDAEGKSGARRMIEDGAMEGVEAVFGLHVDAGLEVGKLHTRPGPFMAAVDPFTGTVHGVAAHGAYPQKGVDPIAITAQVLNALYAIPSRRISPLEPCVVTLGSVHGGTANNVIPGEVTMTGTIRSFKPAVRDTLWAEVRRAFGLAEALGGKSTVEIEAGYPILENAPEMVALLREVALAVLGRESGDADLETGSEDFSMLIQAAGRGGAFAWLGGAIAGDKRTHHHPRFDVDEDCLPQGAAILAGVAYHYLAEK